MISLLSFQRQRITEERSMMSKKLALKDMENTYAADRSTEQTSNVEELYQEISVCSKFASCSQIVHLQSCAICFSFREVTLSSFFPFFQQTQDDIQQKELFLEKIHVRMTLAEEKANDLKKSFENLCGMKTFL